MNNLRVSREYRHPSGTGRVRFTANERNPNRVTVTNRYGKRTSVSMKEAKRMMGNLRRAGFKVQTRATASVEGS